MTRHTAIEKYQELRISRENILSPHPSPQPNSLTLTAVVTGAKQTEAPPPAMEDRGQRKSQGQSATPRPQQGFRWTIDPQ